MSATNSSAGRFWISSIRITIEVLRARRLAGGHDDHGRVTAQLAAVGCVGSPSSQLSNSTTSAETATAPTKLFSTCRLLFTFQLTPAMRSSFSKMERRGAMTVIGRSPFLATSMKSHSAPVSSAKARTPSNRIVLPIPRSTTNMKLCAECPDLLRWIARRASARTASRLVSSGGGDPASGA